MSGTYLFVNGFYERILVNGFSDMPATFQKMLDQTLKNIQNKFSFLDEILIVTKGSLSNHELDSDKVLTRLNEENLAEKSKKANSPNLT